MKINGEDFSADEPMLAALAWAHIECLLHWLAGVDPADYWAAFRAHAHAAAELQQRSQRSPEPTEPPRLRLVKP